MEEVELPEWSEEELQFAEGLNKVSSNYNKMILSGEIQNGIHLHSTVEPIQYKNRFSSSDVGNVQHIVPGIQFRTATYNIGASNHNWQVTACAGSSLGIKGMLYAAKVMAVAGIKAIEDPTIIKNAKTEFKNADFLFPNCKLLHFFTLI